jgi:hypothetical protein
VTEPDFGLCCAAAQVFSRSRGAREFGIASPEGSVFLLFSREDGEIFGPILSRVESFAIILHALRPSTVSVHGAPGEDVSELERIVDLAPRLARSIEMPLCRSGLQPARRLPRGRPCRGAPAGLSGAPASSRAGTYCGGGRAVSLPANFWRTDRHR